MTIATSASILRGGEWLLQGADADSVFTPERMTDGLPGQFSPFESGYDPADPVDRAIMATRNVTFPLHGLMPVP